MNHAQRRFWIAGFWGLAFGVALAGCDPGPRFEGRSASYWQLQIKSRNVADRWRAAVALGKLTPPEEESVRALARATGDPDSTVRFYAVQALVRLGPAAAPAAPELRERLQDSTPPTRELARQALAQIENGAAGS
ncbi:MAG TPA: HEAT repeat domain-containing protein [Fimbriiglobus sp.]|jgi:HEAT repeat protein|nr:HEAT repeat domain-containing protein [Fimbriiglobus sp.]